ncbi:hypothetical protein PHYBOEH_005206 [Phytophthora boehmeriae]|uniref:FYVE-type domain-containing protein n=1 Tax=Phytophthora boehmeriae TaxID=109152 RepID=A0A8T1WLZ0_9STRA|nr:hypothetical protein PHYBOEH_005206 [Phytophthora boehmeriae]
MPRFPLPAGYFGDVELSTTKRQEFREVVRSRVSTMLADEIRYAERRDQQRPIVPVTEWKAKPPIGELNVYQRRRRGRSNSELAEDENFPEGKAAVASGNASIVANGRVKGSIEEMLYGMSATTQGDMMTGLAFTAPPKDCVLLGVVESATAEDPLHSAELLWVLTKIPLIKQRDVCYLKATGVEQDRNGRYGYMILHSVDLPECPPFDPATKVVRAKMFFACLFRERTPGQVDVVARGIFDLSGKELLKVLLKGATGSLLGGLLKGAECGKAKKLTMLARRNTERRRAAAIPKQKLCSLCIEGERLLSKLRLYKCLVCGMTICSNCKATFMTGIRPAEPEYLVVADFYRRKSSSSSTCSRSAVATTIPTPPSMSSTTIRSEPEYATKQIGKSDVGKPASSIGVTTNSTFDGSCTSFDIADSRYSGTLSDLNSDGCGFRDVNEQEKEPESSQTVLPELMKEFATIDSLSPQPLSARGLKPWGERHRFNADDFTRPAAQEEVYDRRLDIPPTRPRPDNLYEWMKDLQSSANEAYLMTQVSGEIMKKSMR